MQKLLRAHFLIWTLSAFFFILNADPSHIPITLKQLKSFDIKSGSPVKGIEDKIPPDILGLDGEKVKIKGFMVPIEMMGPKVKTFLLVTHAGACCYGDTVKPNDLIYVSVKKGAHFTPVHPILVEGTLNIGEKVYKNTQMTTVFEIVADRISKVKNK